MKEQGNAYVLPNEQQFLGKVQFYSKERGFGYLETVRGVAFFPDEEIKDGSTPELGDIMRFGQMLYFRNAGIKRRVYRLNMVKKREKEQTEQ